MRRAADHAPCRSQAAWPRHRGGGARSALRRACRRRARSRRAHRDDGASPRRSSRNVFVAMDAWCGARRPGCISRRARFWRRSAIATSAGRRRAHRRRALCRTARARATSTTTATTTLRCCAMRCGATCCRASMRCAPGFAPLQRARSTWSLRRLKRCVRWPRPITPRARTVLRKACCGSIVSSALPAARQTGVLRAWLADQGLQAPSRARLLEVLDQARNARSDARLLVRLGSHEVRRYRGLLLLKRCRRCEPRLVTCSSGEPKTKYRCRAGAAC